MILGIPVQDGHELTDKLLESLAKTVRGDFTVVILDNNSDTPYNAAAYEELPFGVEVVRFNKNVGYYAPLKKLYDDYDDELIGLIHNDMVIYEEGWNVRMEDCFTEDPQLELVGMVGSYEVDERGGRGGGTVLHFRGEGGYQSQAAGARIHGLVPSGCLDSVFMMFRRSGVEHLEEDWDNLPLAHFYDRIWPLKLVEQGYHVATLGVECDHMGGMTTVANPRYHDDCVAWLNERGIPYENPETEMYLVAERRYLGEYRDQKHFIPCRIREDYSYVALS